MQVNPTFLPPISSYLVKPAILPSIRSWATDDQPREKLLRKGPGSLSHAELLAILIGSGNKEQSAVSLAQSVMKSCDNNLSDLGRLGPHELMQHAGIGSAKAATILAAMELCRRKQSAGLSSNRTVLYTGADAAALLKPLLEDQPFETVYAVYLNHANKLMGYGCISTGGRTSAVVDVRLVFEAALLHKATRLVICHNHPSGNLRPSQSDVSMTRQLVQAGKVLDIEILDHVIVADTGYFSFREDGLI